MEINYPAVRALNRVFAARQADCGADALFDGGEWSSSAAGRMNEDAWESSLEYVAARFDMDAECLDAQVHCADTEELYKFMDANR